MAIYIINCAQVEDPKDCLPKVSCNILIQVEDQKDCFPKVNSNMYS